MLSPSPLKRPLSLLYWYRERLSARPITKRGDAMSGKKKDPSEKAAKEPRRDDLLWKELLSRFFVPMLHSLLPDLARDLDERRDVAFLDKELRRLARFTRRPEGGEPDGNRFVDLLANVPLRTQEDAWVLLHVEVQGRGGNEDFPLRMHRYRSLLEGRYRRHVCALALLIEPLSEAQSCGVYSWEGYGTRVKYEFPVFKLYEGDEEALKASDNPFDWAHLAGLRAWKSRNSEPRKLSYLKEMLKLLDERGWDHADKAQLLVFMEGVIHLTEDESSREYEEWENTLEEAKEAGRMYVSILERKGIEKGRIEGIQLGEERGIKLGEARGIKLGEARGIKLGEARGEARGIASTARRMLVRGVPLEQVVDFTGLSRGEVEALRGEMD